MFKTEDNSELGDLIIDATRKRVENGNIFIDSY